MFLNDASLQHTLIITLLCNCFVCFVLPCCTQGAFLSQYFAQATANFTGKST